MYYMKNFDDIDRPHSLVSIYETQGSSAQRKLWRWLLSLNDADMLQINKVQMQHQFVSRFRQTDFRSDDFPLGRDRTESVQIEDYCLKPFGVN